MKRIVLVLAPLSLVPHALHADMINIYNATNANIAVALVQVYKPASGVQPGQLSMNTKIRGSKGETIIQAIEPKHYAALERPYLAAKVDTVLLYSTNENELKSAIASGFATNQSGVMLPFYKVGQVSNTKLVAFQTYDNPVRIDQEKKVRYTLPEKWSTNDNLKSQNEGVRAIINTAQIDRNYQEVLKRRNAQ